MYTTLSSKGQVTVPVAVRQLLKLNAGDLVDFVVFDSNRVEVVAKKRPVSTLRGFISHKGRPVPLEEMDAAVACGGES